ncbi:SusC/RagA family TonB-linked outer membrane protein [Mucilaginibacter pedocola]|uniref:SusC/RagA family protein n=1 Tax=Mucilaginibacter pedocola TaxID=1792845 RepID=A0A1S9PEP7_9SPHI|nr:TonB-dependent receptor [Mucilaginibacter pedocola]OOQ59413.1 SusC/RagA family protein [Mucilaginibacter pedocola]
MRKILLMALLFLSLFVCPRAGAQTASTVIKGTVSDEKRLTLPGVSVRAKNSQSAAITDKDGNYSLSVRAGTTELTFSFIGMKTQDVVIGKRTVINVTLISVSTALSDVVVIGYGQQKRQDVNGAISSLKASDFANVPQPSVDQLLQGRVAGVTVTQNSGAPGSQTSVHIRGISSLSGSNEPLYVIDGVPIFGDANNRATSGRSAALGNNDEVAVSPLSLINPSDIESIDVLKDASSTAIYGSRGSNGVIIVTTKRGKNGNARIGYDSYYGFQQQGKFLPMMNLQQYAALQNALADNVQVARRSEFASPELLGLGTNWQNEVFRTAPQQSHQLSVSGGKDGTDYYVSGGYFNQDGTILGSKYKRYSLRSNINSQVKEWLKFGAVIGGSRAEENRGLSDNNGIIYTALLSAPDVAVRNPDGTFAGPITTGPNATGGTINPVAQALSLTNTLVRHNVNSSLYADLKLYRDLTLRSEVNGDFNWSKALQFNPTYAWGGFVNKTATLNESWQSQYYWGWKEYFSYNHTFAAKHNIYATLGYEVNEAQWNGIGAFAQSFYSNDLQTLNLGDAKSARVDEYKGSQSMQSGIARIVYTYNGKYSLTATGRSDRSSKFSEGHQTGFFPSLAISWRLSEEKFMAGVKGVADNIKLRASYGQVGNQNVPNYLYGAALKPSATGFGTGFLIDKIANANLTWESGIQTDFGIDFSLFNNRIEASADYYDRTSKNFLFQAALPAFLVGEGAGGSYLGGVNPPYFNSGKLSNKGFEFSINSRNIASKDFRWNTTLVFSHYKNKVLSLANGTPFIAGNIANGFLSRGVTRTAVGQAVGEFYGYVTDGIFKSDAELASSIPQFGRPIERSATGTWLGDIRYKDLNNDGKIDEKDQTYLGNPNPKFTYGITNTFSYKSVDLSVFLSGSYGAKILNALNYTTAGLSGLYVNQLQSSANFWSPSNPTSNIPAPRGGLDNPNLFTSDRFLESGSYLRIQNVNLAWNLPQQWTRKIKMNRLKVFANGQNLYTFTKYKGLDPEIGAMNQNVFLTNIDLGRYPSPRTVTFGINAEF